MGPISYSIETMEFEREKMGVEPKRRKIEQGQSQRSVGNEERPLMSEHVNMNMNVKLRIEEGKRLAIAQAQQDNCCGNYKIFDSPFGNYFVPLIPTRNDLSSK